MFAAGEPEGVIGIRFDRKREFRTEEIELAQALANQAMLALQLTRLSEKSRRSAVVAERNRMAREVHDTLAQGFTGVIVQLEAAEEAMTQNQPAKVAGHLERAGDLARESLKEARQSVKALRPRALEDNNLGRALQDLLTKMTSGTSMTPELTLDGEPRQIPQEWENNLLRIGQEVLTNAVRHSKATEFHCRLSFCNDEVSLHLRDNGIGFDPAGHHEGFGLLGIRERAETMAGKLAILSEKGRGVSISVVLPFDSRIQNHEPIN
jgi:signal transduction histidine kinase